jgi:hypothetical protein
MTRAMLVTVLYRLEGSPAVPEQTASPTLRKADGTQTPLSGPPRTRLFRLRRRPVRADDGVTREQLAAMLRNYAGYKKRDVSASADLSAYKDAAG